MSGMADLSSPESEIRPTGLNDRWTVTGICIFLAVITFAVFGQTAHYKFVNFDDDLYVYGDAQVVRGLTLNGIARVFTHGSGYDNWDPLTAISHMLDCQLYGLNPGAHHLTNVLLHTVTVILLFLVLRQMTGFLWRSAFVAAVFAIHPLRVESVAWISERKDVLSGVFFMLTLGAYVRYARRSWSPARYGLVVFLFALGLLSKPMLVTLPFVLLLLDYWPLKRFEATSLQPQHSTPLRLIVEKIPLLALSFALCVATVLIERTDIQPIEMYPLHLRIGNALISYVTYLGQMIYPAGLAVLYPYPTQGQPVWDIILAILVLASISAGIFFWRRKYPYLLVGWLWYLIMLVPVIGLIQVGLQARADRHTYLPQIGLYVLLTWAATDLCAGWRHRRVLLGGGSTIILIALFFCAHKQTSYWKDSESLWTHTLACTSDNAVAHYTFGDALSEKGNVNEAIAQYRMALQINPNSNYLKAYNNLGLALFQKGDVNEAIAQYQMALQINPDSPEAHYNLGNALIKKGNVDEAIAHFQKALQINPDSADAQYNLGNALIRKGNVDEAIAHFEMALQINPDNADAHYNLGTALLLKHSVDEAIAHFQKALQINPNFAEAQNNLANALLQKGNLDEAIAHFEMALQINPDYAEAQNNLANALLQKGNLDQAIAHFEMALQINPDYVEVQKTLAWVLATCPQASLRNGNKAVELAQRANQLTGNGDPVILGTLAAAYAEAGRFPEAVETGQRALQLAQMQPNTTLANILRSQLKLYQAGLPFHLQ